MKKIKGIISISFVVVFFTGLYFMFRDKNEEVLRGDITIWANSINYEYLNKSANEFMRLNKKCHINVVNIQPYDYDNKLKSGFKTGTLPNIIQMDSYTLATLDDNYKEEIVLNQEPSIVETYYSNFNNGRIKEVKTEDNELLGIPLTSRPIIMFLRQDMMDGYGYNHEDINTWDDVISMGRDIYEKSGGRVRVLNATGQDYNDLVYLLIMQSMEKYSNEDDIVNDVKAKLDILKDNNILNLKDGGEFLARISSINGFRELQALEVECNWTANNAPAKEKGSNRFYVAEGTNLVVINKNDENRNLIRRFIGFLTTNTKDSVEYIRKVNFFISFMLTYNNKDIETGVKNFTGKSPLVTMANIAEKAPTIKDYKLYRNVVKQLLNK